MRFSYFTLFATILALTNSKDGTANVAENEEEPKKLTVEDIIQAQYSFDHLNYGWFTTQFKNYLASVVVKGKGQNSGNGNGATGTGAATGTGTGSSPRR